MQNQNVKPYQSIADIQQRKELLLSELRKSNKEINILCKDLFTHKDSKKKKGFSMSSVMNTGMGIFDGAMLAWKLYRKFKR